MSHCRTFAKRSSITSIQSCIQGSHIDHTDPCSNTKTPILSKFSPNSPPLSQLVTAHSHRLARTTNPFSTLYHNPPYSACILVLLCFPKTYPPFSQHLFSNYHLEFSAPGRKIVKFMGAWCSRKRHSQWLDYLLPPQRLCVPGEAFTITTKKSAIPSTGPLHSDNASTPPIHSVVSVQNCITRSTLELF